MHRGIGYAYLLAVQFLVAGAPSSAVQLAYNLKPGEQLTYRFTQSGKTTIQMAKVAPQEVQTSAQVTNVQQVVALDSSGNAVVEMKFQEGKLTALASGKRFEIPFDFPVVKLKLSRSGSVLSAEVVKQQDAPASRPSTSGPNELSANRTRFDSNSLNMSQFFGQMSALGFPQRDLAVGESWSKSSDFTTAAGEPIHVTTQSTLKRVSEVRGYPCAEIETTATFPMKASFNLMDVAVKAEGEYTLHTVSHFAIDAGRLIDLKGAADVKQKILLTEPKDQATRSDATDKSTFPQEASARSKIDFAMTLQ